MHLTLKRQGPKLDKQFVMVKKPTSFS